MTLKKFMIERDIPKVGSLDDKQLSDAANKSNEPYARSVQKIFSGSKAMWPMTRRSASISRPTRKPYGATQR